MIRDTQTEFGYEERAQQWDQQVLRPFLEYAQAHLGEPFRWGRCDCHTLALGWLDKLTGGRLARRVLSRYHDLPSARAWAQAAGLDLVQAIRNVGGVEVPQALASVGDFVLVPDPGEPWHRSHLCAGAFLLSSWPGSGVRLVPMSELPERYLVLRVEPCHR